MVVAGVLWVAESQSLYIELFLEGASSYQIDPTKQLHLTIWCNSLCRCILTLSCQARSRSQDGGSRNTSFEIAGPYNTLAFNMMMHTPSKLTSDELLLKQDEYSSPDYIKTLYCWLILGDILLYITRLFNKLMYWKTKSITWSLQFQNG